MQANAMLPPARAERGEAGAPPRLPLAALRMPRPRTHYSSRERCRHTAADGIDMCEHTDIIACPGVPEAIMVRRFHGRSGGITLCPLAAAVSELSGQDQDGWQLQAATTGLFPHHSRAGGCPSCPRPKCRTICWAGALSCSRPPALPRPLLLGWCRRRFSR